jgi:hypothetical protein
VPPDLNKVLAAREVSSRPRPGFSLGSRCQGETKIACPPFISSRGSNRRETVLQSKMHNCGQIPFISAHSGRGRGRHRHQETLQLVGLRIPLHLQRLSKGDGWGCRSAHLISCELETKELTSADRGRSAKWVSALG